MKAPSKKRITKKAAVEVPSMLAFEWTGDDAARLLAFRNSEAGLKFEQALKNTLGETLTMALGHSDDRDYFCGYSKGLNEGLRLMKELSAQQEESPASTEDGHGADPTLAHLAP